MAGKKREKVREEDVTVLKYFDKLAPLLARLHEVGCQRDKAGKRTLHYDQYCLLVLLFFFNPVRDRGTPYQLWMPGGTDVDGAVR